MNWVRIIRDTKYPASEGLAIDEALLRSVEKNYMPNTIRFYYFAPPAVVLGLNQDSSILNLNYINQSKMMLGRRLTGGGTIIIGCPHYYSQMGVTFLFTLESNIPSKLSHKFKYFSKIIMDALILLGLAPEYSRNSDILINGRKIVGNGIYLTEKTLLFHSIVLFEYDYVTMLKVLNRNVLSENSNLPEIKRMKKKITTLNDELKRQVRVEEMENAIIESIMENWEVEVREDEISELELKVAQKLHQEKYDTDEWNFQPYNKQGLKSACFVPSMENP
ncbi:MAG: lipoate--protein ligase family protein [Candidatus Helarchaeota archaeon]